MKSPLGALAVAVVLLLAIYFRQILLAGTIGLLLGVVLVPLVRWWHCRVRLPYGLSVVLTALMLLAVLAGVGWLIVSLVSEQVARLIQQAPAMLESLQAQLQRWLGPWGGIDLQQVDWTGVAQNSGALVLGGAKTGLEAMGAMIVIFAIAIFTAANPEGYLKGFASIFPPGRRTEVLQLGRGSAGVVRRWLGSQCLVVLISGLLTAGAMALLGADYWLLIGLLTMILDFIPLFGALLTGAVAVGLTLGTEPDKAWWVLLAFVLIQQLETDVMLPLVMRGRIRLPEVPLLLFVLMLGTAFGVPGVFLAPPLFAILHYLYVEAYLPRIEGRRPPVRELASRRPV